MQAGPLFLEETKTKGRRQIAQDLLKDGIHPTKKGLEVWGDYIVKRVREILEDQKKAGLKGTSRAMLSLPTIESFVNGTIPT